MPQINQSMFGISKHDRVRNRDQFSLHVVPTSTGSGATTVSHDFELRSSGLNGDSRLFFVSNSYGRRSHACSTYGLCPLPAQGLRFYAVRGGKLQQTLFRLWIGQLPTTRARRSRRGKWFHTSFGPIGGVQLFTFQRLQSGAGVVGVWWVAEKQ